MGYTGIFGENRGIPGFGYTGFTAGYTAPRVRGREKGPGVRERGRGRERGREGKGEEGRGEGKGEGREKGRGRGGIPPQTRWYIPSDKMVYPSDKSVYPSLKKNSVSPEAFLYYFSAVPETDQEL